MTTRILLGLSCIRRNFKSASRTIAEFGRFLGNQRPGDAGDTGNFGDVEVVLGIDTESKLLVELEAAGHKSFSEVYAWHEDHSARVLSQLDAADSRPFHRDFSYGGMVNRLQLMSRIAGCDYTLRIDPGTLPPEGLWSIIDAQRARLEEVVVVSGVYGDRLALRIPSSLEGEDLDHFVQFIENMTGVAPRNQITGGALWMTAGAGVPAMPFSPAKSGLTLVWSTDDAIFQVHGDAEGPIHEHRVPRHDATGTIKTGDEYYRGIAGMVALRALTHGDDPQKAVDDFARGLDWHLGLTMDPRTLAPDDFIEKIREGLAQYAALREQWPQLVSRIARMLARTDLRL